MITVFAQSTTTVNVGSEHSLSAPGSAGEYQLVVDTSSLANGDNFSLRIYTTVASGNTRLLEDYTAYYGPQPPHDIIKRSRWYANDLALASAMEFTLQQNLGTGRPFPWKVLRRYDPPTVSLGNVQGVQFNTALGNFEFPMYSGSGTLVTSVGPVGQRSLDGGAFSATANSGSEVGSGIYKIDLAAADLNGTVVTFMFTASGALPTPITIKTVRP